MNVRFLHTVAAACLLAGAVLLSCGTPDDSALSGPYIPVIGDPAPDFNLPRSSDDRYVSLEDILEEGPFLLAFFPAAFSPG